MQLSKSVQMLDLSAQPVIGIKGAASAQWLNKQGFSVPTLPNHWVKQSEQCLILRLGSNEYLLQQLSIQANQNSFDLIEKTLINKSKESAGIYHVPRADASIQLIGDGVDLLLSQVCRLDIENELQEQALLITHIAGVNAILLKATEQPNSYRFWFDQSYQSYIVETLTKLANAMTDIE